MEHHEQTVLDAPEKKPKGRQLLLFGYLSLLILLAGLVFKFLEWPGGNAIVIAGFLSMTTRNSILFLSKVRSKSDWFYFSGRILLVVAIVVYYLGFLISPFVFVPAMLAFLGGILLARNDQVNKDDDDSGLL